jgi:Kef-type K+ transport system membrane component KefB
VRPDSSPTPGRLALGYATLAVGFVLIAVVAFSYGSNQRLEPEIEGVYSIRGGTCLGRTLALSQSGSFVSAASGGSMLLQDSVLSGDVRCADGATAHLEAQVSGRSMLGAIGSAPFEATRIGPLPVGISGCASERLTPEQAFGRLMLAMAAVILAARLLGAAALRIGQPRVMGEVLAGILLGPSLLGVLVPCVQAYLFPGALIPATESAPIGPLSAVADVGLAFYMFLVGVELDPATLRGRVAQSLFISNASFIIPFGMGIIVAVPLLGLIGSAPVTFAPFALFMGVAMSITAFPVLARILVERRMLHGPIGAITIAAAAVDDVTAWCLLALATGVATSTGAVAAVKIVILAGGFATTMALLVRRLLARVSTAYDEAGHVSAGWIACIFVGILLSAYLSALIGIAAIFGAFVMGLVMPRRAELTNDVTRRMETLVSSVLLPLFFVVTGLRTQIGSLDRPELWLITLLLIAVAVAGKFLGATGASRFVGIGLRESAAIGALMNTRGLTELIVLNVGLDLHVITPTLFTMLVIMALVTTFMTGPVLKLIDRDDELTASPAEDLRSVAAPPSDRQVPTRAVLVSPQDRRNLDALLALAEPLARSAPSREVILAQLVQPSNVTSLISIDNRHLAEAGAQLRARRDNLRAAGIAARSAAFLSAEPDVDLVRLAQEEEVDLLLLDGSRPILGSVVPRGLIGSVLEKAVCDVGVLIARSGRAPAVDGRRPVVVPFGGSEHDWAALELGSWVAGARGASLRILGASGDRDEGGPDASRLLARASLVIQRLTGLAAEPVLVEAGGEGVLAATIGGGLLVIGLSDRWRSEGIGDLRSAIARKTQVPVLFVRRGYRPGALAPRRDFTRFVWSSAAHHTPDRTDRG